MSLQTKIEDKKCKICGRILSSSLFNKSQNTKDKLNYLCKDCQSVYSKNYREKNADRIRLQRMQYRANNSEIIKKRKSDYNKKNADTIRDKKKEKYNRNIEVEREKSSKNYYAHKERWIDYRHRRKEKHRLEAINRNKLKRTLGNKIRLEDIQKMLVEQKNECFYCGIKLSEYHLDHIIPIKRGGEHKLYNIVLSCPTCNLHKAAKLPEKFVEEIIRIAI